MNKVTLIAVLICWSCGAFAQLEKANKLFELKRYAETIDACNRVLKKGDNPAAYQKLGMSYLLLRDYTNAEVALEKAIKSGSAENIAHLYYGKALMSNNKPNDARVQFKKFVEKEPTSVIGNLLLDACDKIKVWQTDPKGYAVDTVQNINSERSEFCAYPFGEGLLFISDLNKDLVNFSEAQINRKPFYSIYYSAYTNKEKTDFSKPKIFSHKITTEYHDGPIWYNKKTATFFFTRNVKKGKESLLKMYTAAEENGKVKKVIPFQYNSDKYNIAHPTVSEDGQRLYFASDMPGGIGEMDIYVCQREGDGWSQPKNMGKGVNSVDNDMFPSLRDTALYFSSQGHPGYGGLDVFVAYENENWEHVYNLKAPLNSPQDDFGILFTEDKKGYISSNRTGGKGSDDLYSFEVQEIKELQEETSISGLFEYNKLPVSNATLQLMDSEDNIVMVVKTDENGKFNFSKLPTDKDYKIVVIDDFPDGAEIYILNTNGERVAVLSKPNRGTFAFKALPVEYYDDLPIIEIKDESFLTIEIKGQIYKKLPGDYGDGLEVYIVNDEGKIIARASTDASGKFVFEKLPPDQQYIFKLSEEDPELKIVLLGDKGEILETALRNLRGEFVYKRLATEEGVITLINEDDVVLKIREDENFVLSNIYYDYDKWDIKPQAAKELDKLVLILKKNKHINVVLSSHTDSRASDSYNLTLSNKRAKSAVDYVISKGLTNDRLKGVGYGEKQLVNNCKTADDCTEEEHAKNRRTEIKIERKK
jgi:outer membrane protein OmpA-like peptidoglycan-associated protein/tetratricopeptide (TPR) repeat protein